MKKIKNKSGFTISNFAKFKILGQLLLRNYFTNFQNYFFSFIFPIILLAIIGEITRVSSPTTAAWGSELLKVIPGIMGLGIISFCIISSPVRIVSLKESVLIKRIAITPIKKQDFVIINLILIFILSMISAMWVWAMSEAFYHNALAAGLKELSEKSGGITSQSWYGFLYFFLGIFLIIFVCASLGMMVASRVQNVQATFGVVSLIFFPNMFFSGLLIPSNLINNSSDVLRWISYFMPAKYPLQIMLEGFFGQNIFDPNTANLLSYGTFGGNVSMFTKNNVPDWFAFTISMGLGVGGTASAFSLWKWE